MSPTPTQSPAIELSDLPRHRWLLHLLAIKIRESNRSRHAEKISPSRHAVTRSFPETGCEGGDIVSESMGFAMCGKHELLRGPSAQSVHAHRHGQHVVRMDSNAPTSSRNLSAAIDEAARLSRYKLSSSAGPASGIVVFVAVSRTTDSGVMSAETDATETRCAPRAFVSTALQRDARMSATAGLPIDRRMRAWAAVDSRPADATS